MFECLTSWVWHDVGSVRTASGAVFLETALPYRIGDEGEQLPLGKFEEGCAVFHDDGAAFLYIMSLAKRDLQYRGFRDERVGSFQYKQEANFLLYRRVLASTNEHEFELYRQSWDLVNRPAYESKKWSDKQQ